MKKVLVVGWLNYEEDEKLAKKYPDIIWLFNREIGNVDKPVGIVEMVDIVDEVMFTENDTRERLAWEIACVMKNRTVVEASKYPIDEEKKGEEN